MDNKTLLRIAKALEELIALVKEDIRPRKKKPKSKIEESLIKQNYKPVEDEDEGYIGFRENN
jgi:hypothetical protein